MGPVNFALTLGAMQLASGVSFDNPKVLNCVRIGYFASQALSLGVYHHVYSVIKRKNDKTVLKYMKLFKPISKDPGELVTTTFRNYDLEETSKLLVSGYMGIAIMGFLHIYFKLNQALFVQSLMTIKYIYDAKPVRIHIFGWKAKGNLQRPFKPYRLFGGDGPESDAVLIAEAEKRICKDGQ